MNQRHKMAKIRLSMCLYVQCVHVHCAIMHGYAAYMLHIFMHILHPKKYRVQQKIVAPKVFRCFFSNCLEF